MSQYTQEEVYRRLKETYCLYLQTRRVNQEINKQSFAYCLLLPGFLLVLILEPENGGSTFLRNVGKFLPD
jgi:hypothetical protein